MTAEGTVVNGTVVLDQGARLPEGARVRVELAEDVDDTAPPPEPYDRAQVLAILRESIEDAKAGRVTPARDVLKQIAVRHGLPLEPGE
jgi:hypothetical protein